jgi:hypothetical protein
MGYSYSIEAATHASESSPFYKGLEVMLGVSGSPADRGFVFLSPA